MSPWRIRVKVASLKTLYALVQVRAAWRECLTRQESVPADSRPSHDS